VGLPQVEDTTMVEGIRRALSLAGTRIVDGIAILAEIFDPTTRNWTPAPDMPTSCAPSPTHIAMSSSTSRLPMRPA